MTRHPQLEALAEVADLLDCGDLQLGDETRELHGVRVRVLPRPRLRVGKATARDDPGDAAKDVADFAALSRLG